MVFTGRAEAESKNKPFGKAKRDSMNRSVRRVMMGVAGLTVVGITATLAGAQTVEVKENPTATLSERGRNKGTGKPPPPRYLAVDLLEKGVPTRGSFPALRPQVD